MWKQNLKNYANTLLSLSLFLFFIILSFIPATTSRLDICNYIRCGRGTCRSTSLFTFDCTCDAGWKKLQIASFTLPGCYVPDCKIDLNCGSITPSSSNASPLLPMFTAPSLNLSDACGLVWCGDGICEKINEDDFTCKCNPEAAVKQLLRLDPENPDSHCCLIKFFHKVGLMVAPVTDAEKLIWNVLEAERPAISQLLERSLSEVNKFFLDKHNDSLMHRAAVAEMIYVLEPDKKCEAVKLIENSTNNLVPGDVALGSVREWKLKDCIAVHKLLGTAFVDNDAALRWKTRCAEYFPYSTYFEGKLSSAVSKSAYNQAFKNPGNSAENVESDQNASVPSNGKLEAFKDLTI